MMKKKFVMKMIIISNLIFSYVYASDIVGIIGAGENINIKPRPVGQTFATKLIGAMQWFGYAIAVGMVVLIGIKYVIASADEKASMKGAFVKYVIGAFIMAGATAIASILFNNIL